VQENYVLKFTIKRNKVLVILVLFKLIAEIQNILFCFLDYII